MFNRIAPALPRMFVVGLLSFSVAVLLGLVAAIAPGLAILLAVALVGFAFILAGYLWARRLAAGDGHLAVYLLLLWLWLVNLPAIVAFDPRGILRPNLFNPQSIGRIALFVLVGTAFVLNSFRSTGVTTLRAKLKYRALALPVLIYAWYLVDAVIVLSGMELLLALYRIAEWILLLLIIVAVVSRVPDGSPAAENWLLRVAFAVLLFSVMITFVVLPISPGRAYFVGESAIGRLGSPFAHPNTLGVIAGMAFFYFVARKPRMWLPGAVLAASTLVASYSRGAWLGFAVAFALDVVLRRRGVVARFWTVTLAVLFVVALSASQDLWLARVSNVLARGGPELNLATASERTEVWRAALVLIRQAPILGHGFVAGPKKIGDVMAGGKTGAYFQARHAHNEFVQAQLDGGFPATVLLAVFLARTIYLLIGIWRKTSPSFGRCVTAWVVMLWTFGMLTPNVSGQLLILGGLLLYSYVVLEVVHARQPPAGRRGGPRGNLLPSGAMH